MIANLDDIYFPTVAIVINTYRRPRSLLRLLACLKEQKHTAFGDISVTIVNDGSHDTGYRDGYDGYPFPVKYLSFPRAEDNTPRLYSLKNLGVRESVGEVVWLVDDDDYFDDHTLFILRLYHALLKDDNPVLVPHYADDKEPPQSVAYYQMPFSFAPQPFKEPWDKLRTWLSFGGTSLWRRDWETVGGVDLRYDGSMGFADLDLGIRLWQNGCQVIQVDGLCMFIEDSETGSHRDEIISRQIKSDPHRNGRLFIEKWGPSEAAKYGIVWDANDERRYGYRWDEAQKKFVR